MIIISFTIFVAGMIEMKANLVTLLLISMQLLASSCASLSLLPSDFDLLERTYNIEESERRYNFLVESISQSQFAALNDAESQASPHEGEVTCSAKNVVFRRE